MTYLSNQYCLFVIGVKYELFKGIELDELKLKQSTNFYRIFTGLSKIKNQTWKITIFDVKIGETLKYCYVLVNLCDDFFS